MSYLSDMVAGRLLARLVALATGALLVASADPVVARPLTALDIANGAVASMAIAGDRLLVVQRSNDGTVSTLKRSTDRGLTFEVVSQNSSRERIERVGLDPSGTGWLTTSFEEAPQPGGPITRRFALRRLDDTGTLSGAVMLPAETKSVSETAVVNGRRLIAASLGGTVRLLAVANDGSTTPSSDIGAAPACTAVLVRDPGGVAVICGEHHWRLDGQTGVASGDGGQYVPRLPGGAILFEDDVWFPVAPGIWHPVDPEPPIGFTRPSVNRIDADGDRALIWGDRSLPNRPRTYGLPRIVDRLLPLADLGPLQPDTRRMITRANAMRSEQGLAPLVADPQVSLASRNHAAYNDRWQEGHNETLGRDGFTGARPGARCAAVGSLCNGSEILHGLVLEDAVSDWYATPFHRQIVGEPRDFIVGAASTTGSAVMNGVSSALVTEPIGLPRGVWTGPLSFAGERPDPGAPCGFTPPYGTAITAHSFVDRGSGNRASPGAVTARDDSVGVALEGCPTGSGLLPRHPLIPDHVYTATTEYRIRTETGADVGSRVHTWSFRAVGDGRPASEGWANTPAEPLIPRDNPLRGRDQPPFPAPLVNGTAPAARLTGSRLQKLGAAVVVNITCSDEACRAGATGTINIPKIGATRAKVYKIGTPARAIAKGQRVRIMLKLSATARTAIKRALRRGRRITVKLKITVADTAGNVRALTRQVKLKL